MLGYIKTHQGISFSAAFARTLVLVTVIASLVMMVIGNNVARAFGLVGAFSFIRFRTVVKEIQDTAFLFLAIVVGMALGGNHYSLALIGTACVLLIAFWFKQTYTIERSTNWYVFSCVFKNTPKQAELPFLPTFSTHLLKYSLLTMHVTETDHTEVTYSVLFKNREHIAEFMAELTTFKQIKRPQLSSANDETST